MARRFELTRGLMNERDLDALVLFGNSGVNRHNNVNPFWLSEYLGMHHCYVVVPRDGDASLFVGLANHVPNAREVTASRTSTGAATTPGRRSRRGCAARAPAPSASSA